MQRAEIVARLLLRQEVERTSCFPLVGASFAARFARRGLADLQLCCSREQARRVAAGRRGFILSTGCLVPPGGAVEAFDVMARACGIGTDTEKDT